MRANQDISQAISQLLDRLKEAEDKLTRTPTAFRWTPAMSAVFPVRLTMSQLLAIWEAMKGAAEYGEVGKSSDPLHPDWKDWAGGECPVHPDSVVEVQLENCAIFQDIAGVYRWSKQGLSTDIKSYRLISTSPKSLADTDGWIHRFQNDRKPTERVHFVCGDGYEDFNVIPGSWWEHKASDDRIVKWRPAK